MAMIRAVPKWDLKGSTLVAKYADYASRKHDRPRFFQDFDHIR
jgi:hypothetical protein